MSSNESKQNRDLHPAVPVMPVNK